MSVWGLFYLQALLSWSQFPVPNALMQEADGSLQRFLSPHLSLQLRSPLFPTTYHSACLYACACEVLSSSHGLIEMTFLLSKLNYSAPLFICSPVPLFLVHQLFLFLSGPKTCAHKSTDPKNRETITCVFIWGLCEIHSECCDLESKSGRNGRSIAGILQLWPEVESIWIALFRTILSIIKVQNQRHGRTFRERESTNFGTAL